MKENKQGIKIRLSTLLFVTALIVIAIMGIFIYKMNNDKRNYSNSIEELNNKIEKLADTIEQNSITMQSEEQILAENNDVATQTEETKKVELDKKNPVEEEKQSNKVTEVNIDDETVKNIYKYVADFSYYDELIAYQSNKVTEKDLKNSLKLLTIFNNLDKKDATKIENKYENEYNPEREHIIYSKETVENKAKEIFGEDVVIKHENASPHDGHSVIYANNEYDSFDYDGGGCVPWELSKRVLISAEKDSNGTMYLYDKYVHLVEVDNVDENGMYMSGFYDIYSASDKKEKLAAKVGFEENKIYTGTENEAMNDTAYNKKIVQNIEKYLGKELKTYKHTFKQNSNGSYYWYSTEPIQ